MLSLVNQLRWVDLIVILLIGRCIYIGIKRGLAVEIFKLAGTLLSAFACLHFYSALGNIFSIPTFIPTDIAKFVAFLLLFSLFVFLSFLIREMFLLVIKLQPVPALDKWGGAFLGGIRSLFLSGMILLLFIVSPLVYLQKGAKVAYFGPHTFGIVAKAYSFTFEKLVKPFFPDENLNEDIFNAIAE